MIDIILSKLESISLNGDLSFWKIKKLLREDGIILDNACLINRIKQMDRLKEEKILSISKIIDMCMKELEKYKPKDKDSGNQYNILMEADEIIKIVEYYLNISYLQGKSDIC